MTGGIATTRPSRPPSRWARLSGPEAVGSGPNAWRPGRRPAPYAARVIHLRIVSPPALTEPTLRVLEDSPSVVNLILLSDAARAPRGDVILCDVAREDASIVLADLRELGLDDQGSIAIEVVDATRSKVAREAVKRASGDEADAVVWETVEQRTSEESSLSWSYLTFMALAAGIAVSGIFTDNPILIVGAMVVSPDFGPLAGTCVAIVERRRGLALRSLSALIVGFALAIVVATGLAWVLDWSGAIPAIFDPTEGISKLIASPDAFTFIVAICAGVAGVLSLSTAKSGALIGVLISVTTIPAAAEVGVSAAIGSWDLAGGAALQLLANVVTLVIAGTLTLALQRAGYARRAAKHHRADGPGPRTAG